jgi:hypothetical protein
MILLALLWSVSEFFATDLPAGRRVAQITTDLFLTANHPKMYSPSMRSREGRPRGLAWDGVG